MKINNQIKELREIAKKYEKDRETIVTFSQLKTEIANELELVQKEIKGIQGELKKERPMGMSLNEFNDKIFKNKFGDLK